MQLLLFSLLYIPCAIYYYYKYKSEGESEETLGASYTSIINEKKHYLLLRSLFQHNSLIYLFMDCITVLLIDLSRDTITISYSFTPIAILIICTLIIYLLFIASVSRLNQRDAARNVQLEHTRFYGLYHFGLAALPFLPVQSDLHRAIRTITFFGYFISEKRFSQLLPFSLITSLFYPYLPFLIPPFWQFWISILFLLYCCLNHFSHQNSSVLPTTDDPALSHFEALHHL